MGGIGWYRKGNRFDKPFLSGKEYIGEQSVQGLEEINLKLKKLLEGSVRSGRSEKTLRNF